MSSSEIKTEGLFEMPFLKNAGLLMTYRCQVTCPHCIIEAGPHRHEEVSLEEAYSWTSQIADYRDHYVRVLALTGGEPFFNYAKLKKITDFGNLCGLFISVITNAYWADTKKEAKRILSDLESVDMFSFSTDVHHLKSIPFSRVRNAIKAAQELNIPYTVSICTENKNDPQYQNLISRLYEVTEKESVVTAITFRAGRAKNLVSPVDGISRVPPKAACSAGSSPIILPDGRVLACIGPIIDLEEPHPLDLGNCKENSLGDIFDNAELNPILHAIRIWGPRKLISIINEAGLGQYLPKTYFKDSICNACYSLLSNRHIVDFLDELSEDPGFKRKIAYARVYYLRETRMAEYYSS